MTEVTKAAQETSFESVEKTQEFFNKSALLTRACNETGLEYKSVRRNLNGETKDVRLMTAVILGEWVRLWESHLAEREALSNQVHNNG